MPTPFSSHRQAEPEVPDRLELYLTRWTAYFALPFGIVCLLAGILALLYAIFVFGGKTGVVVGCLGLFVGVALGWTVVRAARRALIDPDPVVVLDRDGLTFRLDEATFIPWSSIERIRANGGDGSDIEIWYKQGFGSRPVPSVVRSVIRAIRGADQTICLSDVTYRPRELARVIAKLHAQAQLA